MSTQYFKYTIGEVVYTASGVILSAFALQTFLLPNRFLDGGVTGMSLLTHELAHLSLPILVVCFNLPFLLMGAYQIGWRFAVHSFIAIVALVLCLEFVQFPPELVMLTSQAPVIPPLFGGFFLGIGVGLGIRGGVALDGIEIITLYTLKRSSLTVSEITMGINIIIFLTCALFLENGWEKALYAMLTYYVATRTTDYVVEGLEEYTGVTIISAESETVKIKLAKEMGRGITVYKGERGFLKGSFEESHDTDIIFTVVTRLEVRRLRNVVSAIDPKAFVFTHSIKEAAGGVLTRSVKH